MKLWTTMPESVYKETLLKNGEYACDTNMCDMLSNDSASGQFKKAYDWLVDKMKRSIGAPSKGVKYPIWAWFRLRGRESRPDLRWVEFQGYKEPMVLIEFEVPDSTVMLSDEVKWSVALLNDAPWCDTDEELEWYYESRDSWDKKTAFKENSWYRVFDTKCCSNVQATLWCLYMEDIKKVWTYNKHTTENK